MAGALQARKLLTEIIGIMGRKSAEEHLYYWNNQLQPGAITPEQKTEMNGILDEAFAKFKELAAVLDGIEVKYQPVASLEITEKTKRLAEIPFHINPVEKLRDILRDGLAPPPAQVFFDRYIATAPMDELDLFRFFVLHCETPGRDCWEYAQSINLNLNELGTRAIHRPNPNLETQDSPEKAAEGFIAAWKHNAGHIEFTTSEMIKFFPQESRRGNQIDLHCAAASIMSQDQDAVDSDAITREVDANIAQGKTVSGRIHAMEVDDFVGVLKNIALSKEQLAEYFGHQRALREEGAIMNANHPGAKPIPDNQHPADRDIHRDLRTAIFAGAAYCLLEGNFNSEAIGAIVNDSLQVVNDQSRSKARFSQKLEQTADSLLGIGGRRAR